MYEAIVNIYAYPLVCLDCYSQLHMQIIFIQFICKWQQSKYVHIFEVSGIKTSHSQGVNVWVLGLGGQFSPLGVYGHHKVLIFTPRD
jgi:hypothetical protein